ncbi:hypothetical protein EJ02DRAFT_230346 [Clathrospora elynae]|uniref:Uncharacterized protein n=1 Tax=Clathrospora elynae TaxID=706981 RepID=A0A6A5SJN3_9PLEO|nr:hypothetical protein EJ02DRAFT_230346 [Clathrospora elynae]
MSYESTLCLNCGSSLRDRFAQFNHLLDGKCPFGCKHCQSNSHPGQLCRQLWLSMSFQKERGLDRMIQNCLQARPSPPEGDALIEQEYNCVRDIMNAASGRVFVASLVAALPTARREKRESDADEELSLEVQLRQTLAANTAKDELIASLQEQLARRPFPQTSEPYRKLENRKLENSPE